MKAIETLSKSLQDLLKSYKEWQGFCHTLSIMRFWLQMRNIKNQYNVEYSNRLVSNEEKIMNKENGI